MNESRALVVGWFSFEGMGATAGDLLARDVVCGWLSEAAWAFDVAVAHPFSGGVDWKAVDPASYDNVVFVCGPFGNGPPITEFLGRFEGRRLIGIGLTMLQPIVEWNPFDVLLERESDRAAEPDISVISEAPRVPVIGVVKVHRQEEYRERGRHEIVDAAIDRLLERLEVARVPIDTQLDDNATNLRTAGEVEALIARTDAVITTRLHGMVLALKNGVPPLVIDPISGGAKVIRQARVLGWPHALTVEELSDEGLHATLGTLLSGKARDEVRGCVERARERVASIRERFLKAMCVEI